jgi:predicted nucleic-acid-binding Zn-ribbon protein
LEAQVTKKVKCNKCGYIGDISEFPKGRDFFQNSYIAECPKCDNRQNPGDASMRMFGGERPFSFVRPGLTDNAPPAVRVMHDADEAS